MALPTLSNLQACQDFVSSASPSDIAGKLRCDKEACRQESVPSLLAYVLPQKRAADEIAIALVGDPRLPLPVARMIYTTLVSGIKEYLANMELPRSAIPPYMIPTDDEFNAALKVLRYLQLPHVSAIKSPSTPLDKVVQIIQSSLLHGTGFRTAEVKPMRSKLCYMCRYIIKIPHRLYPSLCSPCGEFNMASSNLSLPPALQLAGKTALVTGARVNLGYHTALRLLRCGANVIVSSRYPFDAEQRYLAEADAKEWKARLKIVGADFRSAKDVFVLIAAVKNCAKEWRDMVDGASNEPILNILINNAAQTLTDSAETEGGSILNEEKLAYRTMRTERLVVEHLYQPRVRGGRGYLLEPSSTVRVVEDSKDVIPSNEVPERQALVTPALKSSWTQSISEIPYEDVISAHSVNTFVPFILLRELLPLMAPTNHSVVPRTRSTIPSGYVVNVSSREGLFEKNPTSTAKRGLHVHTNMSKAALNMLTETEAASAWKSYKIAINSVDPGYMSADPMFMEMIGQNEECPIGWEDGAGRVLWPIAQGEKHEAVWGRFLKHFQGVSVGR